MYEAQRVSDLQTQSMKFTVRMGREQTRADAGNCAKVGHKGSKKGFKSPSFMCGTIPYKCSFRNNTK